jgi:hypothetical protein
LFDQEFLVIVALLAKGCGVAVNGCHHIDVG